MIKLELNERFLLKIIIDEGYIFYKKWWDFFKVNRIISLINNCGKLRDYKLI